jgi:hypothetical protein
MYPLHFAIQEANPEIRFNQLPFDRHLSTKIDAENSIKKKRQHLHDKESSLLVWQRDSPVN